MKDGAMRQTAISHGAPAQRPWSLSGDWAATILFGIGSRATGCLSPLAARPATGRFREGVPKRRSTALRHGEWLDGARLAADEHGAIGHSRIDAGQDGPQNSRIGPSL